MAQYFDPSDINTQPIGRTEPQPAPGIQPRPNPPRQPVPGDESSPFARAVGGLVDPLLGLAGAAMVPLKGYANIYETLAGDPLGSSLASRLLNAYSPAPGGLGRVMRSPEMERGGEAAAQALGFLPQSLSAGVERGMEAITPGLTRAGVPSGVTGLLGATGETLAQAGPALLGIGKPGAGLAVGRAAERVGGAVERGLTPFQLGGGVPGPGARLAGQVAETAVRAPYELNVGSTVPKPPRADSVQKELYEGGTTLTPGMMGPSWLNQWEQKLASVPVIGSLIAGGRQRSMESYNTYNLNQVLKGTGRKVEGFGLEGLQSLKSELSDMDNKIYSGITLDMNKGTNPLWYAIEQRLKQTDPTLYRNTPTQIVNDQIRNRIHPIFEELVNSADQNGMIAPDVVKSYISKFKDLEKDLWQIEGDSLNRGRAIQTVRDITDLIYGELESQNPGSAKSISDLKKRWAQYYVLQDAATGRAALQRAGGMWTPKDVAGAIWRNTPEGVLAAGQAMDQAVAMPAGDILGNTVPDSGTAGRLALMGLMGAGGHAAGLSPAAMASIPLYAAAYSGPGMRMLNDMAYGQPSALVQQLYPAMRTVSRQQGLAPYSAPPPPPSEGQQ